MADKADITEETGFDPAQQARQDLRRYDECVETVIGQLEKATRTSGIWKYYVANFVFQFVLLGTEMDMVGLGMSFLTYWHYDFLPLQVLAVYAIVGFGGPLIYMTAGQLSRASQEAGDAAATGRAPPDLENHLDTFGNMDAYSTYLTEQLSAPDPHGRDILFYHWFPGARFYMFLKRRVTATDVTGLFKVNTLSSFTFGIFQLMGIAMTYVLGEPFTVFVLVNCISQVLNWTITFSYAATPIGRWMGNAAYAQTLSRTADGLGKAWNTLSAKRATVMCADGEATRRQRLDQQKTNFMVSLKRMILNSFFPITEGGDAPGERLDEALRQEKLRERMQARENAVLALECMRDEHVIRLIELWRNQVIANLDMKGGF